MPLSNKCCVRSLADSVTVKKWDRLLTQPIWTAAGTTTQHGSPASWGGDVHKVVAICLSDDEAPETITDVEFREKNGDSRCCVPYVIQQLG
jgi:hypothetical protein